MRLEQEIRQQQFSSEYHKLAVNIMYTHGWLVSRITTELKPHDITVAQYNILRILRGQHPSAATISLLKERMLDKMSDTSRLVERLRIKGLVERHTDTADRRRVSVRITSSGLKMLEQIGEMEDVILPVISSISPEDARQVNAVLDAMRG